MSGYIGNIPVPQATQTRQSFTATASQTTFNTAGYSPGYVDVFLNGVKLAPADYTATNGSDVVLAVGAASGDILETVAYEIFQVVDQDFTGDFTVDGTTFVVDSTNNRVGIGTSSPSEKLDVSGNIRALGANSRVMFGPDGFEAGIKYATDATLQIASRTGENIAFTNGHDGAERMRIDSSGNLLVGTTVTDGGYDDADGGATTTFMGASIGGAASGTAFVSRRAAPLQLNRQANDGNILTFRKDGSTVGSIGTGGGRPYFVADNGSNGGGFKVDSTQFYPVDRTGAVSNGVLDLGYNNGRWKDLYLSGGVYLGGTGAANKLDDYEEGTFTPALNASTGTITLSIAQGAYVKVGGLVHVILRIRINSISGASGSVTLTGLPFLVANKMGSTSYESWANVEWDGISTSAVSIPFVGIDGNSACDVFINTAATTNNIQSALQVSDVAANASFRVYMTYQT